MVLASNHLSFIDSIFLPLVVDRPVVFLAKSEYFTGKGLKGWATKRLLPGGRASCPSTARAARRPRRRSNTGLRVLGEGGILGIYPEGTRSPDGRLYRGRTGVARMVLEAGRARRPGRDDRHREGHADRHAPPQGAPHRHHHRRAARLHAGSRGWRATASCCAPSPTSSCTSCARSAASSTSTSTRARSRSSAPSQSR